MFEAIFAVGIFLGLLAAQAYVSFRLVASDRPVLSQMGRMFWMNMAAAAIWYLLTAKYGWSMPGRRGLLDWNPARDAGFMFMMGWVMFVVARKP